MRRTWLSIAFLLLVSILATGAVGGQPDRVTWYPVEAGEPRAAASFEIAGSARNGVTLDVLVPGFDVGIVETKAGPRGLLRIPEGGVTGDPGSPSQPVVRYLVEVPPGASVDVELRPVSTRRVGLAEIGLDAALLPVQLPVPKIAGAREAAPFSENVAVYATDRFLPEERAVVADRAILRGRHVALVELRPVRYNPVAASLEVWSRAELTLRFEGGNPEAAARAKGRLTSRDLDAWIDRAVVSAMPGPGRRTSGVGGGPGAGAKGMLVVAHDDLVDAVAPLLDWKRKTGFKVELIRTSDLGSNPSDADVKAAVQQRYDSWSDPSLEYLLVVGDTDFTPIHDGSGGGSSQVTDNWYACLEGSDYLPEIAVARISTRSAQETSDVVDKLLTYERATFADHAWIKKAGFIGTADTGHVSLIEGTHDWCIDNYYTPNAYLPTPWSYGAESCDRHYYSYDADTAHIAASIDAGRSIVNYSGHGGTYSWQGPTSHGGYEQSDVRGNTNDEMYPFVISNACITGTLDATECFGETWQKVPNAGAIAFWGASNNSYWDEDDVLQRDLHDNIFPMDTVPPIGVIINATKLDLYDHYGDVGAVAYYFDMYNLLSEPSLSLWTRHPRSWTVTYPETHPIGESSVSFSVTLLGQPVEGALVAVRKQDEAVFEAGYTDAAGQLVLTLDPAPEAPGTLEVTATGHDFLPHEGLIEVISPDSPWLVHRSHAVDDAVGGDGDGAASPGESFVMPVTVENVGELFGTQLAGTLTTSTPQWVEILDGQATFPDLGPGEQGTTLPDHLELRVDESAPDGVMLGFQLHWTAAGDASGTTSFGEQVIAVNLDLSSHAIDDVAGGNGNGVAGPGETVEMELTLVNSGHRDASGITGTIGSASPYITILQAEADYPDIPAQGQGTSLPPAYSFAVSEDAPDQQPATFTLTLTEAGSGFSEVIEFEVMISSCSVTPSDDVPHPINDNTSIDSDLEYLHAIDIADLNVFVDISHTYQGDLRVILESPSGATCVLHDRTGGSTDNLVTWYDTETAPTEPLSVFDGENAFGTWTLTVQDEAGGDTGTLNGWALEICGEQIEPIPELDVVAHAVTDEGTCDPDGSADVGETVLYDVTVANVGWGAATDVQTSLASDALVQVLNNPVELPDIGLGGQAVATFEVLIGAVECLETAEFTVSLQASEGSWVSGFSDILEGDVFEITEVEDLEHGGFLPPGWDREAAVGVDDWFVVQDRNHTPGGRYSWFSSDQPDLKDDRLISPSYALVASSTVEFWHWIDTEDGYDGGVLEITDDDGQTWIDLGPYFTEGFYDGPLGGTNPISGRDAWNGTVSQWRRTVADLSSWAGETVRLRWRMTCDGSVAETGWWLDDIVVHSQDVQCDDHPCGIPGEVPLTAVSKDDGAVILEWLTDPVCLEFGIWRSSDPSSAGAFADVTAEDPDPTDTLFRDESAGSVLFWIIEGRGPDGPGPWGHF